MTWTHRTLQRALFLWMVVVGLLFSATGVAYGEGSALEETLRGLTSDEEGKAEASVARIAELSDSASALPALEALCDERLSVAPDGALFYKDEKGSVIRRAATGAVVSSVPADTKPLEASNSLRRVVLPLIARLKLGSPDIEVRLAAAEELAKRGTADTVPLLRAAFAKEGSSKVKGAMALALAKVDLQSPQREVRLQALATLKSFGTGTVKTELLALVARSPDGAFSEPDEAIRAAAASAMASIESRERTISLMGNLVHGISLASVLLFAALGLAVTFGLMGVINMAHGEMLMLGAYTTYAVQQLFEKYWPGSFDAYLALAVPAAFVVTTR
jgi:urea transport system permease protein